MRLITIFILFWGLVSSPLTFSETTTRKNLIVGVDNTLYFPIYANDTNAHYYGYSRDLIDAFAQKYNYSISFRVLPIERLYKEFWNKTVDLKFPDSPYWKSEQREGLTIHYTKPVLDYVDGVVVVPDNLGKGIDNFKRLGLVRGFTAFALLDDIKTRQISLVENNSLTGILEQVLRDRADGAYVNIDIAHYQLTEILLKPDSLVFDPDLPYVKGSYHMSSLTHPEVIEQFNQFMVDEQEMVINLKKRYGLKEWSN